MTLTEMLDNRNQRNDDRLLTPYDAQMVFKEWLKTVGLPDYHSLNRDASVFNTTEALRQLLIALVDEP